MPRRRQAVSRFATASLDPCFLPLLYFCFVSLRLCLRFRLDCLFAPLHCIRPARIAFSPRRLTRKKPCHGSKRGVPFHFGNAVSSSLVSTFAFASLGFFFLAGPLHHFLEKAYVSLVLGRDFHPGIHIRYYSSILTSLSYLQFHRIAMLVGDCRIWRNRYFSRFWILHCAFPAHRQYGVAAGLPGLCLPYFLVHSLLPLSISRPILNRDTSTCGWLVDCVE
ncbi:uncharacterized protein BJ171DRAFT_241014 [Polychytrium aggregatum]|uniref:uncharacterized protein n=1 Tax=Polychytrium aggregatum TaxID=110093 RepID=UPI0022FEC03A|nr:uncharacterized protein BJ171DRAFT_241014 [Polychytrium aggregatum]KAI9197148.1 hypothetical protein BJ171DRAFT_241014 [Polychytrium aggregatum]